MGNLDPLAVGLWLGQWPCVGKNATMGIGRYAGTFNQGILVYHAQSAHPCGKEIRMNTLDLLKPIRPGSAAGVEVPDLDSRSQEAVDDDCGRRVR